MLRTKIFKSHLDKVESLEVKINTYFKSINVDSVDIITIKQVVVRSFIVTTVFYLDTK